VTLGRQQQLCRQLATAGLVGAIDRDDQVEATPRIC
jgi:hypothetical protein